MEYLQMVLNRHGEKLRKLKNILGEAPAKDWWI